MSGYEPIDRQALLAHLYDVRALELTKYKLITEMNNNSNQINHLGYKTAYVKPKILGKVILISVVTFIICIVIFIMLGNFIMLGGNVFINSPNILIYLLSALIISLAICALAGAVTASKELKKLKEYNKNKSADELRVEKELAKRQELIITNEKDAKELKELGKILEENYSINLIPSQFRNVEGVCYLYDYLSTSRESFQSALLNYNMNRLNINMQKMIAAQSDMLIQQYITNAKLSDMNNHNKAVLSKLSSIEQNSQLAAKYAAMNEMNTRTISFFKTYEFLRYS